MAKFKIKSEKKDNSHPGIKKALRRWVVDFIDQPVSVLDVYGGRGVMYRDVWSKIANKYYCSCGDSVEWLNNQSALNQSVFDVDPYASPYEALEVIFKKATQDKIGIVCTDGYLRRVCLMRTKLSKNTQRMTGWPERDLSLMAGIYHRYPSFLKHLLNQISNGYQIERLAVKYGQGTWKQATCYYAAVLCR